MGNKATLGELKLTDIRPRGWMLEQMRRDIGGFAGNLHRLCKEASSGIYSRQGRISGSHIRAWWDGETEGNWIDGLTRMAYLADDAESIRFIESYFKDMLREADEDGYIGIYRPEWRFRNDGQNGELWTLSRRLLAMIAYWEATSDKEVWNAIQAATELIVRRYSPEEGGVRYFDPDGEEHDLGKSHGLMVIEPMLLVYEVSRDERILRFVRSLYEDFSVCNMTWTGNDCQLPRLLDGQAPFVGHGAHTCEHLRIPLLLYYYTGEDIYKRAFENGFRKLNDYVSVSGACKSDELIGSDRFACRPLPTSGYEYCAVTEQLLSLHCAAMLTGDGTYADRAEWLLFNAAQALRSHDGKGIAYLGADNQYEASKRKGTRWDISPTHDDEAVCCAPNAVRILPYHVSRMWMRSNDGGLKAMFYGPCVVNTELGGVMATIEQETEYPFEETVRMKIGLQAPASFPLRLRIPGWSRRTSLSAPRGVAISTEGEFFVLNGEWKDGDEIVIAFTASVEAVPAADHTKAVRRGPLLYALNIPARNHRTREYQVEGLYDVDWVPDDDKLWNYTMQIKTAAADLGFSVRRNHSSYPWSTPAVELETEMLNAYAWPERVALVPIGCTILRKTCFPYVQY